MSKDIEPTNSIEQNNQHSGISRRDFLKLSGGTLAALTLSSRFGRALAQALPEDQSSQEVQVLGVSAEPQPVAPNIDAAADPASAEQIPARPMHIFETPGNISEAYLMPANPTNPEEAVFALVNPDKNQSQAFTMKTGSEVWEAKGPVPGVSKVYKSTYLPATNEIWMMDKAGGITIFNQTTGFRPGGHMDFRITANVVALPDGRVAEIGGDTTDILVWNPTTGLASVGGVLPDLRSLPEIKLEPNGRVVILAGESPDSRFNGSLLPTKRVTEWDPNSGLAVNIADLLSVDDGSQYTLIPGKNQILVTGGSNNMGSQIVDLASHQVIRTPNQPTNRYNHTVVAFGPNLYLIGGVTGQDTTSLMTVDEYNAAAGTWSTRMNLPLALGQNPNSILTSDGSVISTQGAVCATIARTANSATGHCEYPSQGVRFTLPV